MRIGPDHERTPVAPRVAGAPRTPNANFAESLATAANGVSESGPPPELSAATYRLFAAIAIERGDDVHADYFRNRATHAREAGLPLHPTGVLAENGRWDYTPAAAALPETGHFDSRSGQGVLRFTSYGPAPAAPSEGLLGPNRQTADDTIDRGGPERRASAMLDTHRGAAPTPTVSIQEWWMARHRVG